MNANNNPYWDYANINSLFNSSNTPTPSIKATEARELSSSLHTGRPQFESDGIVYEYATEAEVMAFANSIRQAGGASILYKLPLAIPHSSRSCLIAKALNFNCSVGRVEGNSENKSIWGMTFDGSVPPENLFAIADRVNTKLVRDQGKTYIVLPQHIKNSAIAFDYGIGWTSKYATTLPYTW